jgi:hypothetical protein
LLHGVTSTSVGGSPGLMMPDGMPLNATEVLASGDTGSNFSAVGTGADDGSTAQLVARPAAGVLVGASLLTAVVVGPAVGVLDEHAAMEIVAAMAPLR